MKDELNNLLQNNYNHTDLSTVVVEFIKKEKEIDVTGEQLSLILSMLRANPIFINNMIESIMNDITAYNLTCIILYDKEGKLLTIELEELNENRNKV